MYSFRPIALCCGLDTKDPNENYWRDRHMIGEGSSLTLAYPAPIHHRQQQQQPYMLLTRPVILTNHRSNQNKSSLAHSLQPTPQQAQFNYVASPYATVYNAQNRYDTNLMSNSFFNSPLRRIENPYIMTTNSATSNNLRMNNNNLESQHHQQQHQQQSLVNNIKVNPNCIVLRNDVRKIGTLSSEVFRQLEAVEKQFDMSIDMDAVEKRGEVITRELESNDLSRCVDADIIRRYHDQYLVNPECYLIRFVEIIKRPGQTLGLYIRTVSFDDAPGRIPPREGVIITKIGYDSLIFNGNVLNVGDEILSVNLVDIQGMSLDDVVIIMSIPKRLILALRSPKYQEQPPILMPRPSQIPIASSRSMHQQPMQQQAQTINPTNNNNNNDDAYVIQTNPNNLEGDQRLSHHYQQQHNLLKENRNLEFEAAQQFTNESYANVNNNNSNNNSNNNNSNVNLLSSKPNQFSNHLHHSPSVVADYRPYDLSQFRPASQMSIHRSAYPSTAPSTPYRNLPTRPQQFTKTGASHSTSSNPDGSSEKTSYFSSSIDAINRELKELRRQRMALDNLNNNISSLDFNDSSIDDDRPIILPSQINLYSSLPNTMTRPQSRMLANQSTSNDGLGNNTGGSSMCPSDTSTANRDQLGTYSSRFETPPQTLTPRTPRILPSPPNTTNMSNMRSQSAFPDYGQLSCT